MEIEHDPVIAAIAGRRGGYFTTADARDNGYGPGALASARGRRAIAKVRYGAWALPATYGELHATEQYAVRCQAVADKLGPGAVLSHHSALAVRRMPLVAVDLSLVHVTRLDQRNGRTVAGVRFHAGSLTDSEIDEVDGRQVTTLPRALWESASLAQVRSGVVAMDAALHHGLVDRDQLERAEERHRGWQGSPRASAALAFADGKAESAGESLGRWMFHVFDLPKPVLQYDVYDENGNFLGRSDYAWPEWRHLGEFDGLRKYYRPYKEGDDASEVVVSEKRREERMCGQRYGMSRLIWGDVYTLDRGVAARVLAQLTQSRRLFG
ncbi:MULTISPECIES: type IV toxin-antitoxin system AbiEi family antitoxin domain-containing protein [Mumia]|uniref:type IV toxin-antitoxin system AbiEi family antitoxin domain-containing protein n=1 Tax=Mumia TaxID=1546255 RepID=UPI00141EB447|nr:MULTISPECIES: type IV toxin-antitoxin system AbiEi family antitoxin domain-containing protein [unclassified Mumia]QMW66641.1 type IV toxin-antitoxin system AbiEi family antitoxin domain-containing protein [Mumia sp. ZJ1417]